MSRIGSKLLKYGSVSAVSGLISLSSVIPVFAAGEVATVTTDVTAVMGVFTSVMSIFSQYPMNLFIAGGLIVMALGIFGKSKRVTK